MLIDVEKPYTLVGESLRFRRRLSQEGHSFSLREVAEGFTKYYQNGQPPPVTRWLPSLVEKDLLRK